MKFEDGSAVTSKDVKYGIERVFAQDVLPGGPTSLISELDQGQKYKGPYTDTDPGRLGLGSVTTPDDSTVVFNLAKPKADFPYLLAMGSASPVPQKLDTGAEYGAKPVSSGPYRFRTVEPGKGCELVRNENWDQSTDPFRKALPDVVELTVTTAVTGVAARLLDGRHRSAGRAEGRRRRCRHRPVRGQQLSSVVGAPNVVHSKGCGLVVMGWIPDYPTGSAFLQPLADGRLIASSGNTDYSEINEPEINGLFDRATTERDPAKAAELDKQINHKVVDGAYFLPIVADKAPTYRNPRLTNVFVNDAFGQIDFQALGVSDGA